MIETHEPIIHLSKLVDAFDPSQNETRRLWRKDHRGVDLISDVLPFGRLWYGDADAYAKLPALRTML